MFQENLYFIVIENKSLKSYISNINQITFGTSNVYKF